MNIKLRKRIFQKLWGWISLSINFILISFFLGGKSVDLLIKGLILSVLTICYGISRTLADKYKNALSVDSVLVEYVGVFILTLLFCYAASTYLNSKLLIIVLAISFVFEVLVLLLITFWYPFKRFLIRKRKT